MTVWVTGNIITAAWMNEVEKVLALGTYGSTSSPRLTFAPNSTFDISGAVATNMRLNGSVTLGANQYFEWIGARTLTSTISSATGVPTAAVLAYDHQYTGVDGTGGYGVVGNVQGLTAGKASSMYGRVEAGASFTGTIVAGTFAATLNVSPAGTSCIVNVEYDATGAYAMPVGILFNSNTPAAGSLTTGIAIDSSCNIQGTCFQWVQSALVPGTAQFLSMFNTAVTEIFWVDALGNLAFNPVGATAGQRIKGDFNNASLTLRTSFQSGTTNKNTHLQALPSGSATASSFRAHNAAAPDASSFVAFGINSGTAFVNSVNAGGTTLPFEVEIDSVQVTAWKLNTDITIGVPGAATGDTAGHMYIQAVAGAPTGVPTGYSGFVAARYDSTNNYLYVYNGGWKKSTVYA